MILSRDYLSEQITAGTKNDRTNGDEPTAGNSEYARAPIAAELMTGYWFGIGVILAIRVVDGGLICCMGCLRAIAANKVTAKMEGQGQVTIKYLKKIEVGKRLAEYNRMKREELTKAQKSEAKLTSDQYYGTGAS